LIDRIRVPIHPKEKNKNRKNKRKKRERKGKRKKKKKEKIGLIIRTAFTGCCSAQQTNSLLDLSK